MPSELPARLTASEKWKCFLQAKGNISLGIMLNGTETEVRAEVARVKEQTRGYRHIVGLSDDLLHNTPLRNSRAFVDEARR